jgi:RNA recognition motif-containing protein
MTNIFVARLDYGVTQEELKSTFEQYGQVNKVSLAIDKETGKSKGFAFIEMKNEEEAHQAIKALDGISLHGRQIAVKQAEDRGDSRPKKDFSGSTERKPFNSTPRENNTRDTSAPSRDFKAKPSNDDDIEPFIPPIIPPVNQVKNDKKKDLLAKKHDDRPKTNKMPAYKKSGKQSKFFYDDEDEDY